MKKKIVIIIITSILLVAGVITTICLLNRNNNINNVKLEEDKKAIQERATVINAKKEKSIYGGKEKYIGEGYYIIVLYGGEIITYTIYDNNDKEIWHYEKIYPLSEQ